VWQRFVNYRRLGSGHVYGGDPFALIDPIGVRVSGKIISRGPGSWVSMWAGACWPSGPERSAPQWRWRKARLSPRALSSKAASQTKALSGMLESGLANAKPYVARNTGHQGCAIQTGSGGRPVCARSTVAYTTLRGTRRLINRDMQMRRARFVAAGAGAAGRSRLAHSRARGRVRRG